MATSTFGTTATTSLTALAAPGSYITPGGTKLAIAQADADIATIQQLIKDDQNPAAPINLPSAGWSRNGQLYVPNRGWLKVLPGDWVAVDATTGWPILVSANAVALGPWAHVP